MIVVTGNCLSSGYEMLDPVIFDQDFQEIIELPPTEYFNVRMDKIYDKFFRHNPKFEKINKKSAHVRRILAQKKIKELEHEVSWPVILGKKLNIEVLNISNLAANFTQTLDRFEHALKNDNVRPSHVIHLIPGHFKVSIETDHDSMASYVLLGNKRSALVTPSILQYDTILHNLKKIFVKPTGKYHLCEEYKKLVRDEDFFDNRIKQGLKRNRILEKEFGYKTFYLLSEIATKSCMGDEIILHDDLKQFARENFKTGSECPITEEYTDYMIDLVSSSLKINEI